MPKAPPPYPSTPLPVWPQHLPGAVAHRELGKVVDILPELGFELLFNDEFSSLDNQLSAKLDAANRAHVARNPAARRPIWSHHPTRSWVQFWRHPSGALVKVDRYLREGAVDWQFNEVGLIALVDKGFGSGAGSAGESNIHGSTGERLSLIKTTQEFENAWREIRHAAQSGCLLPLDRLPAGVLDRNWLIHQSHNWPLPKVSAGQTPAGLSQLKTGIKARSAPALGRRRLEQLSQATLPEAERQHWRHMVGKAVAEMMVDPKASRPGVSEHENNQAILATPVPSWALRLATQEGAADPRALKTTLGVRQDIRRVRAIWDLHHLLERFGLEAGDPLSESERATVGDWLDQMVDRQHPARRVEALEAAHAKSLPRFGLHFHHLLLANFGQPGGLRLARAWQNQQRPEDLARACAVPDNDGLTLPMRWAHAWLHLPNSRALPRRLDLAQEHARRALEQLKTITPVSDWTLASTRASIWDEALDIQINASVDDDLVPYYQKNLESFSAWAGSQEAALPTNAFLHPSPGSVSLLDTDRLHEAFIQHDPKGYRGHPDDRVRLLGPLVALMQQATLSQASPLTSLPKTRSRL